MSKFGNTVYKRILKNFVSKRSEDVVMLEPHFGLGDNLICIGLVKTLSARYPNKKFYYACLAPYYHSLVWAFQGLPNIYPTVVRNGREVRQLANFLHIPYWPIGISEMDIGQFDECFYRQHDVPFDDRWSMASTSAGPQSETLFSKLNPSSQPYILICGSGSHGQTHDLMIANPRNLKFITVHAATQNIFDWTKLVQQAEEIHTIDTGFIHFVENTLPFNTAKPLFFHRARGAITEFTRRLPWQEVDYSMSASQPS